ncbi:three-helix bundle dimerization domain-containing protein [Propionicimonas sp. T2.31MG-18]
MSRDVLSERVIRGLRAFAHAPIRDFVPVLVERRVRAELRLAPSV